MFAGLIVIFFEWLGLLYSVSSELFIAPSYAATLCMNPRCVEVLCLLKGA